MVYNGTWGQPPTNNMFGWPAPAAAAAPQSQPAPSGGGQAVYAIGIDPADYYDGWYDDWLRSYNSDPTRGYNYTHGRGYWDPKTGANFNLVDGKMVPIGSTGPNEDQIRAGTVPPPGGGVGPTLAPPGFDVTVPGVGTGEDPNVYDMYRRLIDPTWGQAGPAPAPIDPGVVGQPQPEFSSTPVGKPPGVTGDIPDGVYYWDNGQWKINPNMIPQIASTGGGRDLNSNWNPGGNWTMRAGGDGTGGTGGGRGGFSFGSGRGGYTWDGNGSPVWNAGDWPGGGGTGEVGGGILQQILSQLIPALLQRYQNPGAGGEGVYQRLSRLVRGY